MNKGRRGWSPLRPSSSSTWTRTKNLPINSRLLCQLSYRGMLKQLDHLTKPRPCAKSTRGRRRNRAGALPCTGSSETGRIRRPPQAVRSATAPQSRSRGPEPRLVIDRQHRDRSGPLAGDEEGACVNREVSRPVAAAVDGLDGSEVVDLQHGNAVRTAQSRVEEAPVRRDDQSGRVVAGGRRRRARPGS